MARSRSARPGRGTARLTELEKTLLEHVRRGEPLDLGGPDVVDEEMRAWGASRTVGAHVVRGIVTGTLVPDPDPRGLRVRGVRIEGRLELQNVQTELTLSFRDCFLDGGIDVCDARLRTLLLGGCVIEHAHEPPVDASRLSAMKVSLRCATVHSGSSEGGVLLPNARIAGELNLSWAAVLNSAGPAVVADGLHTGGGAFFRGTWAHGTVQLTGARIGGQLDASGGRLVSKLGPALMADGVVVDLNVVLQGLSAVGAGSGGAVRIVAGQTRQLDLSGASIWNGSGPALSADAVRVEQDLVLADGLEANGSSPAPAVMIGGVHVGGDLVCAGARLGNPRGPALAASGASIGHDAFLSEGFSATGAGPHAAVELTRVQVGGALYLDHRALHHASDPLRRCSVVDLRYGTLPQEAEKWLELLRRATPEYAAQPYQQLAQALQAAGHDDQARIVMMRQRDDQLRRHALAGTWSRTWVRVTGLTVGHGYAAWRALLPLAAVVLAAVLWAWVANENGGMVSVHDDGGRCPTVEAVAVGLDIGLPLIETGARDRCDFAGSGTGQALMVASWFLQLLSWAFATLFVAGFTGIVRRR